MSRNLFQLVSSYRPTGDQPEAIAALLSGLEKGRPFQTLEGVTGSGKTFTVANVIRDYGRPALVISHNKTLAAQLYAEFREFFPHNAVQFFISYYDYYQPEAYIPQTDTYIEKDSSINEEIERLRLATTDALLNRDDVIIVASVSCIYGLGSPEEYRRMQVRIRRGERIDRDEVLSRLVDIQYARNDIERAAGSFRARGETIEVYPAYTRDGVRIGFHGDEIERIQRLDADTGRALAEMEAVAFSPARHFVMPQERIDAALEGIRREMEERVQELIAQEKLLEAQRLRMRTTYDLEMLKEMGYCGGIENYSRHLTGRAPGEKPATLLDFFPSGFLTILDESHVTVPQIRAMYNGDRSRKEVLVEHGFRLPSALDNRPLMFNEFLESVGPVLFTTATPGPFELQVGGAPVRQILRPTGLLDPLVEVRPLEGQVDDLIEEVRQRTARGERTLVTTLTKKTAEHLAEYLQNLGMRVQYLHADIGALERVEILRALRKAECDCLIGINLLREGLDLPEVSLVAILDADKEGFLRSETSLIQTAGRAARHVNGRVILYADRITDSMRRMMDITGERRAVQVEYNQRHNITPRSIVKRIQDGFGVEKAAREIEEYVVREEHGDYNAHEVLEELQREMLEAAEAQEYERAALLRDQIAELKAASEPGGKGTVRVRRRGAGASAKGKAAQKKPSRRAAPKRARKPSKSKR